MSKITIKEIKTTLEIDQEAAQLLVDALLSYASSLTTDRDGCMCSFCEDPRTRAKKILDIYFEAYPLSKVARSAIGIPTLKEIEDRLTTNSKEASTKGGQNE